jgi:hypothetical protein
MVACHHDHANARRLSFRNGTRNTFPRRIFKRQETEKTIALVGFASLPGGKVADSGGNDLVTRRSKIIRLLLPYLPSTLVQIRHVRYCFRSSLGCDEEGTRRLANDRYLPAPVLGEWKRSRSLSLNRGAVVEKGNVQRVGAVSA